MVESFASLALTILTDRVFALAWKANRRLHAPALRFQPKIKVKDAPMRIGELSRQAAVSTSRIRFYEKHKLLPPAVRRSNGYRDYPLCAVKTLSLIDGAQRLGFSLGEIRAGLSDAAPDFPSPAAMSKALQAKLASVERHIEEAQARSRQLTQLRKEMGG